MSNVEFVKGVYAAFGAGDIPKVLGSMHPQIQWTQTAGYTYGGVCRSPQAVLENVFAKIPVGFESFSIDVERLLDAGNVVVMQGHYVAKGKESGKSVRAAVACAGDRCCTAFTDPPPVTVWLATECRPNLRSIRRPELVQPSRWTAWSTTSRAGSRRI